MLTHVFSVILNLCSSWLMLFMVETSWAFFMETDEQPMGDSIAHTDSRPPYATIRLPIIKGGIGMFTFTAGDLHRSNDIIILNYISHCGECLGLGESLGSQIHPNVVYTCAAIRYNSAFVVCVGHRWCRGSTAGRLWSWLVCIVQITLHPTV